MLATRIKLDRTAAKGLVPQLFEQIRGVIEAGSLAAGSRLPTSRQLAAQLGVGRNSVLAAYDLLEAEGYLHAQGRRGTFVSEASRGFAPVLDKKGHQGSCTQNWHLSRSAQAMIAIGRRNGPSPHTFQPGLPDVRCFPHDLWGRCLRRAARRMHQNPVMGGYAHYHGLPDLREALIDHVAVSRGVSASAEQVIVFSSAQAALDLVARLLLDPGDVALHEAPGYAGMLAVLRGVHADIRPMDVQAGDMFRRLEALVADGATPRLIYVSPSHQFPTGRVMSLEDRLALLAFAAKHGAVVLEDDYDSEFHFSNAPLSCLQGLGRDDQVLYMGTMAKSLMPSLRLAYLVVPMPLVEPIKRMQRNMGAVPGLTVQWALADFLSSGHFRSHVRDMSKVYQARRDCLAEALATQCGDLLVPDVPDGGIQMPAYLAPRLVEAGVRDEVLLADLAQCGIECTALSSLYWPAHAAGRQGLLFGYAASNEDEIVNGVEAVAHCLNRIAP